MGPLAEGQGYKHRLEKAGPPCKHPVSFLHCFLTKSLVSPYNKAVSTLRAPPQAACPGLGPRPSRLPAQAGAC